MKNISVIPPLETPDDELDDLPEYVAAAEHALTTLTLALAFYADPNNYKSDRLSWHLYGDASAVEEDGGKRAREALKECVGGERRV